jgi:hypothetical protein
MDEEGQKAFHGITQRFFDVGLAGCVYISLFSSETWPAVQSINLEIKIAKLEWVWTRPNINSQEAGRRYL